MKNRVILILSVLAVVLASCSSHVPFDSKLQSKYGLKSDAQFKKIQFFISSPITLYDTKSDGSKNIEEGALVDSKSSESNVVKFESGTACVVERVLNDNTLLVRFEGGKDKFLVFSSQGAYGGQYKLQAEEWTNRRGKLTYGGKTYYATFESGNVFLTVKQKKLNSNTTEERTVKGMKIN